jgi:hypothetical protein
VELRSKIGRDPSERPVPREPRYQPPRATPSSDEDENDDFEDR